MDLYISFFVDPLHLAISHKVLLTFVYCILVIYQVILYGLSIPKFENKCKLQANLLQGDCCGITTISLAR